MSEIIRTGIPEPDDCNERRRILLQLDGRLVEGWACWYPQMGGYVGCALAVPSGDYCVDVYVWHDGEFPFAPDDGRSPVILHHCGPDQFIEFGKFLDALPVEHEDTTG